MRYMPLLAAAAALAMAPSAMAAPARTLDLTAGAAAQTTTWQGTQATGLNATYWDQHPSVPGTRACTTDVQSYCDTTLVKLTNVVPESDVDGRLTRTARVTLSAYSPVPDPATDFDLVVYDSNEAGAQGAEIVRDANFTDTANETVSFSVTTTREQPTKYVLVQVVYFLTVQSGYTGAFRF